MTALELQIVLIAIGLILVSLPLGMFLFVGWHVKKKDILDGLNKESRLKYFEMFCRIGTFNLSNAMSEMDLMYLRWYGRRHFTIPLLMLLVVCATALYIGLGSAFAVDGPHYVPLQIGAVGMSAVAGAYMWVGNDLISRARRLDLSPSDLNWASLRLAISIPLGVSISAIAAKDLAAFIAFAAGAFPLATLMDFLRRTAASRLGYEQASVVGDEIVKLQGVNEAIASRLISEDIATITQVAYCDPVRLTMRSNLSFNVVTDLMNQALGWEYLGEGMNKIRALGLRGAVEIKHLQDALQDPTDPDHPAAVAALPYIAKALDQSDVTLAIVFREITRDPFTVYLNSIWE